MFFWTFGKLANDGGYIHNRKIKGLRKIQKLNEKSRKRIIKYRN